MICSFFRDSKVEKFFIHFLFSLFHLLAMVVITGIIKLSSVVETSLLYLH